MPINFLGKLILSKLLNETANEINVGTRINDQSHLMKTEEIKPAKMQLSGAMVYANPHKHVEQAVDGLYVFSRAAEEIFNTIFIAKED